MHFLQSLHWLKCVQWTFFRLEIYSKCNSRKLREDAQNKYSNNFFIKIKKFLFKTLKSLE